MIVASAQIAPVFLDRDASIGKVVDWIDEAGRNGVRVVAFGETLVPGYPVWLGATGGASFESQLQKEFHAKYLDQGVVVGEGMLDDVCRAAVRNECWVVLGVAERFGHTLYASCVTISADGEMVSVHRKLMPTYEERLSWGIGDGAGLVTHRVDEFTMGSLNCWENWMPLARASLYELGENLHVAIWPGSERLTKDITRFVAREGRSFVLSASGLVRSEDVPEWVWEREKIVGDGGDLCDGGSCLAGPEGEFRIEPMVGKEGLVMAEIDLKDVFAERQNFDVAGHYSRPEILRLRVDRERFRQ